MINEKVQEYSNTPCTASILKRTTSISFSVMEWLLAGIIFSGKLAIGTASTLKYVFFFQSNDWVSCSKQSSSKWLLNNAECSEGSYLSLSLNQPIFFLFSFFTLTGSFENRKRHVFKLPVSWPLLLTYHSLVSHWNKGSHTIVAATFSHPYLILKLFSCV